LLLGSGGLREAEPEALSTRPTPEQVRAYAQSGPLEGEPPPAPCKPEHWALGSQEAARAQASAFLFGKGRGEPPGTDQYPFRQEWVDQQQELGLTVPPRRRGAEFKHIDTVLVVADDPWTPFVGRNDARRVWRVRWRTEAAAQAASPEDLRFETVWSVWIDPIDGAFLRGVIGRARADEYEVALPADLCKSGEAQRFLWASGPEYWRSCLVSPPIVGLAQSLEAGSDQVGAGLGSVAIVHAVNWRFSLSPERRVWCFQFFRSPPSQVLGPTTNSHWVSFADTGQWYTGTSGAACPTETKP